MQPVLIDFDIADMAFNTEHPDEKGGLGTPVFAAPEQIVSADDADERSDIYSLGRLLHYFLIERSPGLQIEQEPGLESLRVYPEALVAIVRRATRLDPEGRYPTVAAMIREVLRHQTGMAVFRAHVSNLWRWTRLHALLLSTSTVIVSLSLSLAMMHIELDRVTALHLELTVEKVAELEVLQRRQESLAEDVALLTGQVGAVLASSAAVEPEVRKELETLLRRQVEALDEVSHGGEALRGAIQGIEAEVDESRRALADGPIRALFHGSEQPSPGTATEQVSIGEGGDERPPSDTDERRVSEGWVHENRVDMQVDEPTAPQSAAPGDQAAPPVASTRVERGDHGLVRDLRPIIKSHVCGSCGHLFGAEEIVSLTGHLTFPPDERRLGFELAAENGYRLSRTTRQACVERAIVEFRLPRVSSAERDALRRAPDITFRFPCQVRSSRRRG